MDLGTMLVGAYILVGSVILLAFLRAASRGDRATPTEPRMEEAHEARTQTPKAEQRRPATTPSGEARKRARSPAGRRE